MSIAVFPGSFDPITNGHIDILRRALKLFDRIIVGVGFNAGKNYTFTAEERVEMVREATEGLPVEVESYTGLLVDFVKSRDCSVVIRSLRASTDFEHEFQMSMFNREYHPDIEHIYLMASKEVMFISSSMVKEIVERGGDVKKMVPANVALALQRKFPEKPSSPKPL
ncbi:MAG: pantetheine-phosphate adenylyltransferase [DPANN group archaeon]|nr:pantetheine-phosphate adenylyltransferase [DPANN group archaeon]